MVPDAPEKVFFISQKHPKDNHKFWKLFLFFDTLQK